MPSSGCTRHVAEEPAVEFHLPLAGVALPHGGVVAGLAGGVEIRHRIRAAPRHREVGTGAFTICTPWVPTLLLSRFTLFAGLL